MHRGLDDNDFTMIKWIRVSGGRRPRLAAELSQADITPDEAGLQLGYGGRVDTRWPSIFERYRDRKINRAEAIVAVRQWRERNAAGWNHAEDDKAATLSNTASTP
jgi:hypothetical protein